MSASLSTDPSVGVLREHFGDHRAPNITRKVTECVACRKQKIKCYMKDSKPPCARCKKRNLPCSVNRSLQTLLEEDTSWRLLMRRKVGGLEKAIDMLANKLPMPELKDLLKQGEDDVHRINERDAPRAVISLASASSIHIPSSWEVVMDSESGPAAIPASCVSTIPPTTAPSLLPIGDRSHLDLISRGVVSLESAESFFNVYRQKLDHLIYRILIDHVSLTSVRQSSPLLTAVIFAVGALHSLSTEFEACYQDFMNITTTQLLSKKNTPDDVRGLCIGAFWLSDMSWTLIGFGNYSLAVRIATEIQLHRCISKMPHEKVECYKRTRLWYLVYICDHQFSIAYGKPPVTHDFETLNPCASFLESKYSTEEDIRLVSEVEIWSINTRVLETFGMDTDAPISDRLVLQLRRFAIDLDTWRANWNERFNKNSHADNYPRKGPELHFHFAKLYLCSHAFRGVHRATNTSFEMSSDMEEFANTAVLSAIAILRIVVRDNDIQSHLNGLPLYFDTMIAFAAVFLLKLATSDLRIGLVDKEEVLNLAGQLNNVLRTLKSSFHPRHLLSSIATSIEKLVERCLQPSNLGTLPQPFTHIHPGSETFEGVQAQDWLESPSETFFVNNYDFLGSQNYLSGFDFGSDTFGFDV